MQRENPPPLQEIPFVNEMRLNARHWAMACLVVLFVMWFTPALWVKIERFDITPDYRVPYSLSKDYWLYERLTRQWTNEIVILGDSVVWGEYVLPNGTLAHFLNEQSPQTRFANGGVNGLFPLAIEGLLKHYGSSLRGQRILLHCNPLWMSSSKADLQSDQDDNFNHTRLVPQIFPSIPAYKADAAERLSAIVERNVRFLGWVSHLQDVYFDQQSIVNWTLANSAANPFERITFSTPPSPSKDTKRGPGSRRHKPWTATSEGPVKFEWIALRTSLQWDAFKRALHLLQERGNNVCVMVGPFNEHMMTEANREVYRKLRDEAVAALDSQSVTCIAPDALPSALYADASHPLTEGYKLLAEKLLQNAVFQRWLK